MNHRNITAGILKKRLCVMLIALTLLPLSFVLAADEVAAPTDSDDLQWVKKVWRGEWRMDPSVDWNKFTKIQLEKATVDFRKNWARDQRNRSGNRPDEKGMQRIKSDLSEQLNEVLSEELTTNGFYDLTEEAGNNVMLITPKIVDLNINAPDRMRDHIGYSLADSKGSMTLELEIRDSVTGTLLASAQQNREDPQKGWMEWANTASNKRAAGFILSRWAQDLSEWLDQARANTLSTTN